MERGMKGEGADKSEERWKRKRETNRFLKLSLPFPPSEKGMIVKMNDSYQELSVSALMNKF